MVKLGLFVALLATAGVLVMADGSLAAPCRRQIIQPSKTHRWPAVNCSLRGCSGILTVAHGRCQTHFTVPPDSDVVGPLLHADCSPVHQLEVQARQTQGAQWQDIPLDPIVPHHGGRYPLLAGQDVQAMPLWRVLAPCNSGIVLEARHCPDMPHLRLLATTCGVDQFNSCSQDECQCMPCSVCPDGLPTLQQCGQNTNTVCGATPAVIYPTRGVAPLTVFAKTLGGTSTASVAMLHQPECHDRDALEAVTSSGLVWARSCSSNSADTVVTQQLVTVTDGPLHIITVTLQLHNVTGLHWNITRALQAASDAFLMRPEHVSLQDVALTTHAPFSIQLTLGFEVTSDNGWTVASVSSRLQQVIAEETLVHALAGHGVTVNQVQQVSQAEESTIGTQRAAWVPDVPFFINLILPTFALIGCLLAASDSTYGVKSPGTALPPVVHPL